MTLDMNALFQTMLTEATSAFGDGWDHITSYAPAEFRKLAVQVADIADNVAKYELDPKTGYPPATGRVLLQMQRTALEAVLTAVTALTIMAVQEAITRVLTAIKNAFGGVLTAIL